MNEVVKLSELKDPVLIAGFVTRRRAGRVGSRAVAHLASEWHAELVARIDSQDFMNLNMERPEVQYAGEQRIIKWPDTLIYLAKPEGAKHDFLLVIGFEPNLHWKAFVQELADYADAAGVKTLISLRGFLGSIPHTRPAPVEMNTFNEELQALFGLEPRASRYEGPTDILGVVGEAGQRRGWRTADLSVLQPTYYPRMRNAAATIALAAVIDKAFKTRTPIDALWRLAAEQAQAVSENMSHVDDFSSLLRELEQQYDASLGASELTVLQELPSGEDVVNEIERILRQHKDG